MSAALQQLDTKENFEAREKSVGIWKTKEGAEIKIADMTDDQLKKAIKFCEQKSKFYYNKVVTLANKTSELEDMLTSRK